jgi:hypothetical protein
MHNSSTAMARSEYLDLGPYTTEQWTSAHHPGAGDIVIIGPPDPVRVPFTMSWCVETL